MITKVNKRGQIWELSLCFQIKTVLECSVEGETDHQIIKAAEVSVKGSMSICFCSFFADGIVKLD